MPMLIFERHETLRPSQKEFTIGKSRSASATALMTKTLTERLIPSAFSALRLAINPLRSIATVT